MVKPVAEAGGYGITIGPDASDADLETCRAAIEADPRGYIAQEVVQLSRHPTSIGQRMVGRHVDLRPFVLCGDTVEVIPGGLTRGALREGSLIVNSSMGGGSRTHGCWLPRTMSTTEVEADVLARHAESLFWAGRYIERAESTARMLDVTYHAHLELMAVSESAAWYDLLKVLNLDLAFSATERPLRADTVFGYLAHDQDNPGTIRSNVGHARENLRSVRELISTELWESINRLHLDLQARDVRTEIAGEPYELYAMIRTHCQAVAGVASETMPRDEGWNFLTLGWMLERAIMTCRLLAVRYSQLVVAGATGGFHHWVSTLKSASGSEAFRRRYRASMDPTDVVAFLLLSATFPRSVLFGLQAAERSLDRIEGEGKPATTRPQRLLGRLRADVQYADVEEILAADLAVYLDMVETAVRQVCEATRSRTSAARRSSRCTSSIRRAPGADGAVRDPVPDGLRVRERGATFAEPAACVPDLRRAPAAPFLPAPHRPGCQGSQLHRLLGDQGRRLRDP